MFRIIAGLVVGGALLASALGSAAGLTVAGGSVQVGSDNSLYCDTDGISVSSWGVNSSDDPDTGGQVTFAQVNGVNDAACQGNRLFGRVEDSSGNVIGYTTLIKTSSGAAETFTVPANINSAQPSGYNDPHNGAGSYKLQLIDTAGGYGVDAGPIAKVVFWIEGGAGL